MNRWMRLGSTGLLLFTFAACDSLDELQKLEVINENNPDRERVLATAGDVESLVASAFFIWHQGILDYGGPSVMLSTAADETTESWGNYAARDMSSEPRKAWSNSPSYGYAGVNERIWYKMYEALSAVYDGFASMEEDAAICEEIDCERARAFGKFMQGISHGYLALHFDSAFVFDETVNLADVASGAEELPLLPYPNVAAAAIGYLDEAISMSQNASWTLPSSWIRGNAYSGRDLARVANAFAVRFLTQVARTPAERDAVNWNAVIQRVDAGLEPGMGGLKGPAGDVFLDGDPTETWAHMMLYFGARSDDDTWNRADYKSIGWADQGTGYANWLATPVAQRNDFVLNSADARIHAPGDGLSDGLDFMYRGVSRFRVERGTYHFSMYSHIVYEDYATGDQSAPMPLVLYEEQQLYKAEGLYRTGQAAQAATIVNRTRVTRGGMTQATGADANLYDKIIYEHIIENFTHCTGCVYYDRRGWGPLSSTQQHHWGLVEGTPRHFPIPGQELEILQKLNYTYGGVGSEGGSLPAAAAPASNVVRKYPARLVYAFNGLDTIKDKLDYIYSSGSNRTPDGVRSLIRH